MKKERAEGALFFQTQHFYTYFKNHWNFTHKNNDTEIPAPNHNSKKLTIVFAIAKTIVSFFLVLIIHNLLTTFKVSI